jgi:hypothetical protein
MSKRFLASLVFFLAAGFLAAQDMPPLPPMPDQGAPSNSNANALPPLPGDSNPAPGAQALPPLPGGEAAPTGNGLPPVPGEPAAPVAEAPSSPAPESPVVVKKVSARSKTLKPWQISKWRPNVIYGGWVKAKGGNESSRLAWTSQEVLNALEFKGYRAKEEGRYDGQDQKQWRKFTFKIPKAKAADEPVVVYLRQGGKKVWLRVGPDEAPPSAKFNLTQVKKQEKENQKALRLIQKKLGRRLTPNRVIQSWDAPYRYAAGTADR